jgi:zinc transporter, ZIP family
MSLETPSNTPSNTSKSSSFTWALALIPLLLLGVLLSYLVVTGGGLRELAGPPVESLKIERITLPEQGIIKIEVINDGPQTITVPQVIVDDAYWEFTATPSTTIPRLGRATYTLAYPWVSEETHAIQLMTSLGTAFEGEIPVAVQSPKFDFNIFLRFALIGFYVGIIPIALGMLWYPWMRNLSRNAMNFILCLTIGLLAYLALGTYLDALEFAAELPAFWQGTPLVLLIAAASLGVLLAMTNKPKKAVISSNTASNPATLSNDEPDNLGLSYRIALGIGLHNLGEGLAIGAAFALGEAALGTFLVLGFTLHNITEGVGIAAPVVRKNPGWRNWIQLALLAGFPAVIGVWVGGFAFNPVLATVFLAIGIGAILQVIWEVGRLVARDTTKLGLPVINWTNLAGVTTGVAIMYFTAFLVK